MIRWLAAHRRRTRLNLIQFIAAPSLLAVLLACAAWPALGEEASAGISNVKQPDRFTLSIKGGFLRLSEDRQTIAGTDRTFKTSADNVYAIEGEGRFEPGGNLSIGGEIIQFSSPFKRTSVAGGNFEERMRAYLFLLRSNYYFRLGTPWQPYLGAGVGFARAHDLTGPIEGVADGFGVQGVLGVQLRTERVGFRLEYKLFGASVTDDKNDDVSLSSHGSFLGVSFYFGSSR